MANTWNTRDGRIINIPDMETSHIINCIRFIERRWPELDESDEGVTADHWSIAGVLIIPGRQHYREKLALLVNELDNRGVAINYSLERQLHND